MESLAIACSRCWLPFVGTDLSQDAWPDFDGFIGWPKPA